MKALPFKRLGLPIAALAFIPTLLHAIIDNDHDNMSDVWEAQHGFSTTSATGSQHPDADPDGDGWTNREEAEAGTDPNSGKPPAGMLRPVLVQHPDFPAIFTVSWPTLVGKEYRLLVSPDLTAGSWVQVDDPMPGTGAPIEVVLDVANEDGSEALKVFSRVEVTDLDTDGDSLTNLEEAALGTNPSQADSDLDGLADHDDSLPLVSATLADPDGANAPAGSMTDLRGFWDFETFQAPSTFPDRSGANRHATTTGADSIPWGMPSKAARFGPTHITIPNSTLKNVGNYTISGWFKLGKNTIKNSPDKPGAPAGNGFFQTLYSVYNRVPTAPGAAPVGQGSGLYVRKTPAGEYWLVGGYKQFTQPNGNPDSTEFGYTFIRPLGTTDDGRWHHFAVLRNAGANTMGLYIDGVAMVDPASSLRQYTVDFDNPNTSITFGRLHPQHGLEVSDGLIDRLRVQSRILTAAEITGLRRQDIDRDGLWDITEANTLLWRDVAPFVQVAVDLSEYQYLVSPFQADPPGKDHDHDKITSLVEQNTVGSDIADADTDDDTLPDGYDEQYGLGALVPDTNLASDLDGDGLTRAQELTYGTDPNDADTDDDGTNDGPEVAQGGRPNDGSDNGDPPDPADVMTLRLAIGDQSGSESENYHLVAYRYNSSTRSETEVYRLQSGGFGKYSGDTDVSIFRKDEEYTFHIEWQGTNNHARAADVTHGITAEGPDYDYTMKVEPVGDQPEVTIDDAITISTGKPDAAVQLIGVKNDVPNFQTISDTKAVKATEVVIDLAVDTNMNGSIESLPDGFAAGSGWPESKIDDRQLDDANPPHSVIIDANNNNSDAGDTGSPTKDTVDNRNNVLDTEKDKIDLTASRIGHCFGKLRVYVYPPKRFRTGELGLRLSYADPSQANYVRVFGWQKYDNDGADPPEWLGPGKTSVMLDSGNFFTPNFPNEDKPTSFRELTMEGLTVGNAVLRLEVIKNGTNPPQVLQSDEVRIAVNVMTYEQKPADVPFKKDALPLRGAGPHYVGLQTPVTTSDPDSDPFGAMAIRGRIVAPKIPNYSEAMSKLTPMGKYPFNDEVGSSFWVGLNYSGADGVFWVQTGLRWFQEAQFLKRTPMRAYIETGSRIPNLPEAIPRKIMATGAGAGGTNVVRLNQKPLRDWSTQGVVLDFIMYRKSAGDGNWVVIFQEARPDRANADDAANYTKIEAGVPQPGGNRLNAYSDLYENAKPQTIEMEFESSMSISMAPGIVGNEASISQIYISKGRKASAPPEPGTLSDDTDAKLFYNWAKDAFGWLQVPLTGNRALIRTGRGLNQGGTWGPESISEHPEWRHSLNNNIFKVWDTRNH